MFGSQLKNALSCSEINLTSDVVMICLFGSDVCVLMCVEMSGRGCVLCGAVFHKDAKPAVVQ